MAEYPKVIEVGGIKVTATDETHEAWWRQNTAAPAPAAVDPVAEAEPEAEAPAKPTRTAPKKKVVAKKKSKKK